MYALHLSTWDRMGQNNLHLMYMVLGRPSAHCNILCLLWTCPVCSVRITGHQQVTEWGSAPLLLYLLLVHREFS